MDEKSAEIVTTVSLKEIEPQDEYCKQ